ncbi:sporulation protein [Streptomyces profundus]|uniref:sporulation protein n=1 Tax=Streptomyces profundus TaxID=2867410 RepID=UPI001D167263|nr:sporulation protein [Streptomyces sp. MA3_2.13]UED83289.1 sporulation protein [Streptomyces sp. MA3_2.13]
MTRSPNTSLATLVTASGASHKAIAHRVNQLAATAGRSTSYTHTSVMNWLDGMLPRQPVPALLAQALGERIGRAVDVAEIGMATTGRGDACGLEFPRDPADAAQRAADFWSTMHRRSLVRRTFAISAFSLPVTRWLIHPAAAAPASGGGQRVGQRELTELWEHAEQARQWDARYGGGNWRTSQVVDCLTTRAAPLLTGTATQQISDGLHSAAAELSRLAGWAAFDAGDHALAQRHFIQALSLARAGGNAELGAYVTATMALQTMRRGYPNEAIDMAQGACERAGRDATPRVRAFAKLIEARAQARAGDERAAARALSGCERLLDTARETDSPTYIAFFGPARMASDAVEIYRDLGKPHIAAGWDAQCAMPAGHTRAVGLRLSVTATAHLQDRDLDQGLAVGRRAVDILAGVASARAREYVEDIHTALTPWAREPRVRAWQDHARRQLNGAPEG